MTLGDVRRRRQLRRRVRALDARTLVPRRAPDRGGIGFFVVHHNAPDFLELNLDAIHAHHPRAPVTVLDNGSRGETRDAVVRLAGSRDAVCVLGGRPDKPRHDVGLQALFLAASSDDVEAAVFLDQDAMLLRAVDDLVRLLDTDALLVGARDAVFIPHTDGPLEAGWMRWARPLIHPSLLLLAPGRVRQALGRWPFAYHRHARQLALRLGCEYEPYHALSVRAEGRIRFLDMRMSAVLPPLTFYERDGRTYACHAWYSARTDGRREDDAVDGLPVSWLRARRAAILEEMRTLSREGVGAPADPADGSAASPRGRSDPSRWGRGGGRG